MVHFYVVIHKGTTFTADCNLRSSMHRLSDLMADQDEFERTLQEVTIKVGFDKNGGRGSKM